MISNTAYHCPTSGSKQHCRLTSMLQLRHLVFPYTALLTTATKQPSSRQHDRNDSMLAALQLRFVKGHAAHPKRYLFPILPHDIECNNDFAQVLSLHQADIIASPVSAQCIVFSTSTQSSSSTCVLHYLLTYLAALLAAVFLQRLKLHLVQGLSPVPRFWRPSLEQMPMTCHPGLLGSVQLGLRWSADNNAERCLIFEVIAYTKADRS